MTVATLDPVTVHHGGAWHQFFPWRKVGGFLLRNAADRKVIMSIPTKFRKKPVVIEAMGWPGGPGSASEVINWMLENGATGRWREELKERRAPNGELSQMAAPEKIRIDTLEGTITATPGDFIIKGVKGEFYPCKPDIFAATYDAVGDA